MNYPPKKVVVKEKSWKWPYSASYLYLCITFHHINKQATRVYCSSLLFLFFRLHWYFSVLKERQENLYNIPGHLSGMQRGCADHNSQRTWCTWASFLHLVHSHLCRTSHCKTRLRSRRKKRRTISFYISSFIRRIICLKTFYSI